MSANKKWHPPTVAITKRMLEAAHDAIESVPEDSPDAQNEDYLSAQIFFAMWTEMHREIFEEAKKRVPKIIQPSPLILPHGRPN